ncbi:hypothetical protein V6957_003772 [Vibrio parahaemolyticus]
MPSDEQYFECCRVRDELDKTFVDLNSKELQALSDCESAIREWEDKHLPF